MNDVIIDNIPLVKLQQYQRSIGFLNTVGDSNNDGIQRIIVEDVYGLVSKELSDLVNELQAVNAKREGLINKLMNS